MCCDQELCAAARCEIVDDTQKRQLPLRRECRFRLVQDEDLGVGIQPFRPLGNEEHDAVGLGQQRRAVGPVAVGSCVRNLQARCFRQALCQDALSGDIFMCPRRMTVRALSEQEQALGRGIDFMVANDYGTVSEALNTGKSLAEIKRGARVNRNINDLTNQLHDRLKREPAMEAAQLR